MKSGLQQGELVDLVIVLAYAALVVIVDVWAFKALLGG